MTQCQVIMFACIILASVNSLIVCAVTDLVFSKKHLLMYKDLRPISQITYVPIKIKMLQNSCCFYLDNDYPPTSQCSNITTVQLTRHVRNLILSCLDKYDHDKSEHIILHDFIFEITNPLSNAPYEMCSWAEDTLFIATSACLI